MARKAEWDPARGYHQGQRSTSMPASTGRTQDGTRPTRPKPNSSLAMWAPSTQDAPPSIVEERVSPRVCLRSHKVRFRHDVDAVLSYDRLLGQGCQHSWRRPPLPRLKRTSYASIGSGRGMFDWNDLTFFLELALTVGGSGFSASSAPWRSRRCLRSSQD